MHAKRAVLSNMALAGDRAYRRRVRTRLQWFAIYLYTFGGLHPPYIRHCGLNKFARFSPDFMAEGRGDRENGK